MMVWRTCLAVLVLGSVALGSCDQNPATAQAKVAADCLDLPVYPPPGVTDLRQETFACVERTAALYARGPDTPDAISRAVIVKCQPTIMHYVEQRSKEAHEAPQYDEALEAWRQHTLPVIAEARARHCYS